MNYFTRFFPAILLVCGFAMCTNLADAQENFPLAKVDQYLQHRLETSSIPGFAIAVVHGDSALFVKGYGKTSTNLPVTVSTPFAIASLSKGFTAMAILQLVEAGQLKLDESVAAYLPHFKLADSQERKITIRQLLHQTSGLADTGYPELGNYEQPNSLDEAILKMRGARTANVPGQNFHYHNPNYQILAKVVEAVSHERFGDFLHKHLFIPLNMLHTNEHLTTQSFFSTSQNTPNGNVFALGHPINTQEPDWFVDGAAGMTSTITDMAQWLRVQLNQGKMDNKQVLNSQSIAIMQQRPVNEKHPYGMGWFVEANGDLHHSGILWTYSAEEAILSKEKYGIVLLFNGGLNAFIDYNSYIRGVTDIIAHKDPDLELVPEWIYPIVVFFVLSIFIGLSGRRLFKLIYAKKRRILPLTSRKAFGMLVRLIPFLLVIFMPNLITLISGRVLNWKRIFLMMPDIIVVLTLLALINIIIVTIQIIRSRFYGNQTFT